MGWVGKFIDNRVPVRKNGYVNRYRKAFTIICRSNCKVSSTTVAFAHSGTLFFVSFHFAGQRQTDQRIDN